MYLTFAAISKLFASLTTYPYQVVRARLQETHCKYSGTVDCVRKIIRFANQNEDLMIKIDNFADMKACLVFTRVLLHI